MAIGTQPSVIGLNTQLSGAAVQLRNAMFAAQQLAVFANAEGLAGLELIGFAAADATAFLSMVSYMNTVAGVYYGTATQGSGFNFDNALAELRGGQ